MGKVLALEPGARAIRREYARFMCITNGFVSVPNTDEEAM
jgi:hypothetical protein